jgi:HEAT repeat protein
VDGLQQALDQLASGQEQEIYKAKLTLQGIIGEATKSGNEAERAKVAKALSDAVINGGKYGVAARSEIARRLGEVGMDSEATTLRSLLPDLELRESARFALDRIPTAGSTAALVDAANDAIGSRFRVGLMNSLGQRRGKGVLEALVSGTKDPNLAVRLAAIEALAEQGEEAADAAITAAMGNAEAPLDDRGASRATKARIRLAADLAAANKKAEAKRIYQSVLSSKPAVPQAKAAQAGLDAIG